MNRSKEIKIGLIVTSGIVLLVWGLNFLKGRDFFSSQRKVFAVYDHVDGLAASNLVQVNGLKVGSVTKLSLLPDYSGRILVTMTIKSDLHIPRNSTAQIFSSDLLGTKCIRIVFSEDNQELEDGDTLLPDIEKSLTQEVNQQVGPIKEKAEKIMSSMDSVLMVVRAVLNENTKNNLKRSFESIANSLQSIESLTGTMDKELAQEGRMKKVFENLESISSNLRKNNDRLTNIIENFSNISDTLAKANLAQTLEKTRATLEGTSLMMEKINRGEGTLGQLVNNDSLYRNLNATSHSLNELMVDLKENPSRYVHFSMFGKKKK